MVVNHNFSGFENDLFKRDLGRNLAVANRFLLLTPLMRFAWPF
jgi:hypothetical protein